MSSDLVMDNRRHFPTLGLPFVPLALSKVSGAPLTRCLILLTTLLAALLTTVPFARAQQTELTLDVGRYVIEGDNPLSAADTEVVLAPFVGRGKALGDLEAASEALEKAIRGRGYSFHRVIVPAQKPEGGVVKLEVLRYTVGKVVVSGNEHFSAENVRQSLPSLKEGEPPNAAALGRDLGTANEHPSKRVAATFKEGDTPDTLDVELRVRDVPPVTTFVGVNNTGTGSTGYYRVTLGHQRTNLFDRDHTATVSYTTSPDYMNSLRQYGLFYQIPFYGYGGNLSLYYAKSDVNTGRIPQGGGFFDIAGGGEFYGARYTQSLARLGPYTHALAVGIDQKGFTNGSKFGVIRVNPDVATRPLTLRYQGRVEQEWGQFGGYIDYTRNLRGGTDGGRDNFAAFGADRTWSAWHYGLDVSAPAGDWLLSGRLRGQWTNQTLVPGEQFGITGVYTVRGFLEREFAGDRGWNVNLEARAPSLGENLVPVFFYDTAGARALSTETSDTVASMGVGLRWSWQQKLEIATDLAYVLNGTTGVTTGGARAHFSLFYRF